MGEIRTVGFLNNVPKSRVTKLVNDRDKNLSFDFRIWSLSTHPCLLDW